jgi:hypothetical protein
VTNPIEQEKEAVLEVELPVEEENQQEELSGQLV